MAMAFDLPPKVRRSSPWRMPVYTSLDPLSAVLFTNQTRLKIDYFLPASHRKGAFGGDIGYTVKNKGALAGIFS